MRPLVQALCLVNSANSGDQLVTRLSQKLATLTTPSVIDAPVSFTWHGQPAVSVALRCLTEAEADSVHAEIVAAWTSGALANKILTGSWVKRTNNYDDEAEARPDQVLYVTVK